MRQAVCREYGIDDDLKIPIQFVSAMTYAVKCYMEEMLVQKLLARVWKTEPSIKVIREITKQVRDASMRRNAAVLKLGIKEKEVGLGNLDFGDDDE
ncbi:hypothetical protein LCGC14_0325900 [marine sediment metagenome]|uniref:Uncharacterized protein n=1 Tax=marine sediment metagenome TaxID=412755 RepID=A0A0F9TNE3_9ZZZZ